MPTKLIVGYIVREEEEILRCTLPKIVPFVDGIVAVDAESKDGTCQVFTAHNASVLTRKWDGSFCNARNACIEFAESLHPESILLMLDADECLTARDFLSLREAIKTTPCLALARYEFVDDFYHFNPEFYPDFQCRVFPLNQGYHYRGILHEQLFCGKDNDLAWKVGRCVMLPYIHIFHYGKCKNRRQVWLKYENYRRISAGEQVLTEVPSNVDVPTSFSHGPKLFFHGERPL